MTTPSYPLQWPHGRSRRAPGQRKAGKFNRQEDTGHGNRPMPLTTAKAIERLSAELDRIGAQYTVVSSNLELGAKGGILSGQKEPADPGIAVYFQLDGKPHCLPCDTYTLVAHNIAAVAAHIEATRAIARHGVASVAEMFEGFLALPNPDQKRPWREVLELHREPSVTLAMAEARYRDLACSRHPDSGGSDAMMADLNVARAAAKRELSA